MASDSNTPIIIDSDTFNGGILRWRQMVGQDKPQPSMNDWFLANGSRQLYLSMPSSWVQNLLSAVGCVEVKMRFLLDENFSFVLALYATDAQTNPVSAYYKLSADTTEYSNMLAKMYGKMITDDIVSEGDEPAGQVPHAMAKQWLGNWKAAAPLAYSIFYTQYGFLKGYNFQRDDLMTNLFNVVASEQQQLRVYFGLHEYYAPDNTNGSQPTFTFGLVLRLVAPEAASSSDPFYDMSGPCPPAY